VCTTFETYSNVSFRQDIRFQSQALQALQEAAEAYLVMTDQSTDDTHTKLLRFVRPKNVNSNDLAYCAFSL